MVQEPMIGLLTGGEGSERTVSLATADTIAQSLSRLGLAYIHLDVREADWLESFKNAGANVALIAVHGTFGEDGGLQKVLETNNIPHTGCNAEVAARMFDKRTTKALVLEIGAPSAREYSELDTFDYPVVVKPNAEGSSVGVTIVHNESELPGAIEKARACGEILIEQYIDGRELSCAVTDVYGKVQALPIVEIKPTHEFFDYDSKYIPGGSEEICPAELSEDVQNTVLRLSERIFLHTKISQYCRIDWILKGTVPYFLEVNTIPGMTPTSLINKEIDAAGLAFDDFIQRLVTTAQ